VLPRDRIASAGEWLAILKRGAVPATVPLVRAAPPTLAAQPPVIAALAAPAFPRESYAASALVGAGLVSAAVAGFMLLGPALISGAPAAPAAEAAAPGPGLDPAPLPHPIAASRWELALPFETRAVGIGVNTVPVVASVLPSAAGIAANDWLAEGVGIYAVNETRVSDQASIEEIVFDLPDAGGAGMVVASLTVRGEKDGTFRQVSLAVPASRRVTLRNGAVLRTRRVEGAWQVAVESVPAAETGGLAAGDILLAERGTGEAFSGPLGFEALLGRLARAGEPEAVFELWRDGNLAEARLALSGE
jgi:hypothetical protein